MLQSVPWFGLASTLAAKSFSFGKGIKAWLTVETISKKPNGPLSPV